MQDISSILFSGILESSNVLVTGMRGFAIRLGFILGNALNNLPGRTNRWLFLPHAAALEGRQEVAILYAGRIGESLMMTSERMVISTGRYTLGQLLCNLYKRGDRWVEELDDRCLMCTVNGREARLFDTIEPGAEICLSSRKSIFEG